MTLMLSIPPFSSSGPSGSTDADLCTAALTNTTITGANNTSIMRVGDGCDGDGLLPGGAIREIDSFQLNIAVSDISPTATLSPGAVTLTATMAPVGDALDANLNPTVAGGYPRFAAAEVGPETVVNILSPSPVITVDRNVLALTTPSPGTNPASQVLGIRNTGRGTLNWTASATSDSNFLGITPTFGSDVSSLTVSAESGSLPVGTHTGRITITAPGALNSPVVVPVVFRIGPSDPTPYVISTIAGKNIVEGGAASDQPLSPAYDVARDPDGNFYIAVPTRHKIFKVTPDGILTTFAGTGVPSFGGDGGPATSAQLDTPKALDVDTAGNVYIVDFGNLRIRKITADGIIRTIAGTGSSRYNGDGGLAIFANLGPSGVTVDSVGNVYIVDYRNNRIRRVTTDGRISTFAGDGTHGLVRSASFPPLSYPIAVSSESRITMDDAGNVYWGEDGGVVEKASQTVRSFVFGNSFAFGGSSPRGLAVDGSGNVFIAHGSILKVSPEGVITTVAGGGDPVDGYGDNGSATAARLSTPSGVLVDPSGVLYIADTFNMRIRRVDPDGVITTIIGNDGGFSGDGGPATSAQIRPSQGIGVDLAGNVFIADTRDHRIRKIAPDGTISTFAGNGVAGFGGDGGPATSAQLNSPRDVTADAAGNVYIADRGNNRIRKVFPDGTITTIAGDGTAGFGGDGGPAVFARLSSPSDVVIDTSSNIFIADTNNGRVRKVAPDGIITTIAGTGQRRTNDASDGGPATAANLNRPGKLALSAAGELYIVDQGTFPSVKKVGVDGIITTPFSGGEWAVAIDAFGNLYTGFIPTGPGSVPVSPSVGCCGTMWTRAPDRAPRIVAGFGSSGYSGDGNYAGVATVHPVDVAVNIAGEVFFVDDQHVVVRKLTPSAEGSVAMESVPILVGN